MDPGFLKMYLFFRTTILDVNIECIYFLNCVNDIVVMNTLFLEIWPKRT